MKLKLQNKKWILNAGNTTYVTDSAEKIFKIIEEVRMGLQEDFKEICIEIEWDKLDESQKKRISDLCDKIDSELKEIDNE